MKIAKHPETILLTKTPKVTDAEISSRAFQTSVDDMIKALDDLGAIGLAAPQIFLSKRIVVYRKPDGEIGVAVNPEIISKQGRVSNVEYCLSCKDGYKVKRFKRIRVAAQDRYGIPIVINSSTKQEAFCLQHEIDHVNGIVIVDKGKKVI